AQKLCDIYSSIGCALSSFRSPLGPPFDFLFDTCSCQTARCFNKSKGVLITGLKLKAFRNPQPSWGFSVHNQTPEQIFWRLREKNLINSLLLYNFLITSLMVFYMFKKSVLFATLLSVVMAFSTNADDKIILKHISVSSVSASPTVLEDAIADIARKYNASSWKVTSMRIDNNSTATAVLYK
ncbi:hypothetical protein G701_00341, partial [Escherichia coli HVH 25 (4-5851939)]